MKLYTEKQVRKIVRTTYWQTFKQHKLEEDLINELLTPIELPSDEEIEKNGYHTKEYDYIWKKGAKWVIEQIKQQDK